MPPTPYRKGARREGQAAARLRRDGYYVAESRGSHGAADLVAIKVPDVLLVQVKATDLDTDQHSRVWWNELWQAAADCGATPIVADWPPAIRGGGRRLRLRRLTAPRTPRSRTWPWEPYSTDTAAATVREGVLARLRAQNAELKDRLAWVSAHPSKPYPGYPATGDSADLSA